MENLLFVSWKFWPTRSWKVPFLGFGQDSPQNAQREPIRFDSCARSIAVRPRCYVLEQVSQNSFCSHSPRAGRVFGQTGERNSRELVPENLAGCLSFCKDCDLHQRQSSRERWACDRE